MAVRIDRRAYLAALCRNVPYCITERVLADPRPESAGSEELEGSVLYADLVGFTALSERLSREGPLALSRLSDLLTGFFRRLLEEAFFPHQGYVIHFGGDSATVVFRGEGHELRAAAAAAVAQEVTAEIEVGEGGIPLRLRIGIGSGATRLLVLGDSLQRLVLTGGECAVAAMRAQGRAEPGTTVITRELARAAGEAVETTELDDDLALLQSVRAAPESQPMVPLEPHLDDRVEDKIALLEPFVPAPLAARLKQMPDGWRIDGELRRVVVVFAEVSRFSRATERLGFESVARLLRTHRRYGGVQFKFDLTPSGHRTLSLFGLHAPTENDAERAVLATLEIMAEVRSLLASAPGLDVRIGIHVGEVYFGAIGSPHRYDITIIGDVVNVAGRAAAAAPSFGIATTGAVVAELSEDFVLEELTPIRFKGAAEPVMLYTVNGVARRRARYMQARGRRRRLSGRELELDELVLAARVARSGRAQTVGVVGEAGTGKSCLLADLIDDWVSGDGLGMIGRCTYAARTEPLAPVREMFGKFLGLIDDDPGRREVARAGLARYHLGEGGEALIEFLATGAPAADHGVGRAQDELLWQQVIAAIESFVAQRVVEAPVLYVLEDLHHADSLTVRLVQRLLQLSRDQRFLFVVTCRSEPSLTVVREGLDREIQLRDLGLRDAAELVARSFGAEEVDDEVAGFLWERTGGNPGRLTELCTFLRDRGLLRNDAQRVVAPPPGLQLLEEVVPASMAQFALGRLEHLSEVERRLLRLAATIGRSFERDVLTEVAQSLDHSDVDRAVVSLIDEGVIAPEASRRPRYRFRDEITRAVAYSTIPESERRDYHRRIADALEQLSDTDVERSAVTLAHHRERAHQHALAEKWYERAIRMAVFAGLDEETRYLIAQWERVVAGLPPEERPSERKQAGMVVRKLVATARHGLATEAVALSRSIATAWQGELEIHEQALVDLWTGVALLGTGQRKEARRALKRAHDRATDSTVRCDAAIYLFKAFGGIPAESDWWLDRARQMVKPGSAQALRVELARAVQAAERGELDEARIINARVRDEARRRDQLRIAAIAASNLADCDLQSGDVDHALRGFEEAIVMSRALGTRSDDAIDQLNLGICHLHGGSPDRAVRHLESALAIATEVGHARCEVESMVHLGLALALSDDIEQGQKLVATVRERSEQDDFVGQAALLYHLHIALLGRDDELIAELSAGVRAMDVSKLPPLLSRLRGKLLRRVDVAPEDPHE